MIFIITIRIKFELHRKFTFVWAVLRKNSFVQKIRVTKIECVLVSNLQIFQLFDEELSVIDVPLKCHRSKLHLSDILHGLVLMSEEQKSGDRGNRTRQCEEAREQGTEACPCSVVVRNVGECCGIGRENFVAQHCHTRQHDAHDSEPVNRP